MPHILALDQGTTSSRAILFDARGKSAGVAQKEFRQIYPRPGWVEHDPQEIWTSQIEVARQAVAGRKDVAALGIANQRESVVVWERAGGRPIHNAIVWQDRRTAPVCDRLVADGAADLVRERTGMVIDPYFSATKIAWILDKVAGARARAEAGELAAGTVDSWLIWRLTEGKVHVTDATNASRTLLFDLAAGDWSDELLALFDVPRAILPQVRSSSEVYGETTPAAGLGKIPIAGIAGDQQAALFGQLCLRPGMAKNTYGTGCFVLMDTGTELRRSEHGLLTTVARRLGGVTSYALEGSVFIAGAVIQWLRDGLGIIRSAAEVGPLAASVPDTGGVVLVPAFAGLGAPHWDAYARGAIVGLTRGTTAAHIARAALEGIAFQVADVIDAMTADAGFPMTELRVDGGAAANDLLLEIQADILGITLVRPQVLETTALGAAYLAGLATGVWSSTDALSSHWAVDRRFEPKSAPEANAERRARWRAALDRARDWEPRKS